MNVPNEYPVNFSLSDDKCSFFDGLVILVILPINQHLNPEKMAPCIGVRQQLIAPYRSIACAAIRQ